MPPDVMRALEAFAHQPSDAFQKASWLITSFDNPVWKISLGGRISEVDWRVRFGDGKLTDTRYEEMRRAFGSWVVVQTHPRVTNGSLTDPASIRNAVNRALAHIDYFLLHQVELKLSSFGFRAVTENDIMRMLLQIESHQEEVDAIYGWNWRLPIWLDEQVVRFGKKIAVILESLDDIGEIYFPEQDWRLETDRDKLINWRAALWLGGFYKKTGCSDFRRTFASNAISEILYRDTLKGKTLPKPVYRELCIQPIERCRREKCGVPVRFDAELPTRKHVIAHRRTLFSMSVLADAGIDVPVEALNACREKGFIQPDLLREPGRYTTLPFWLVMECLRQAVDFIFEHGEHLIDSYAQVLTAAYQRNVRPSSFVRDHDLRKYLSAQTLRFGVQELSIGCPLRGNVKPGKELSERNFSGLITEYFDDFRANKGLVESMKVLFGAMVVVFGTMSARRQGELLDLPLYGALDEELSNVIFENRKSGSYGLRQKESRPVPPVCGEIVRLCQRLHVNLANAGLVYRQKKLFEIPGVDGVRAASSKSFNEVSDAFCDYFQTPTDKFGRRWYIRQHQLRKFFVLAFYYGATWSNLATLRWMLGHVDVEHLWNYLTKSTPGAMLNEAASYFVTDMLQHYPDEENGLELHESAAIRLGDAVQERFGTRNYSIIDAVALEGYILRMTTKGLQVSPHFIYGSQGKTYKIAISIQ